ncbi:hypothetical protein VTN00DRAFT_5002 [Thermoascus crustaceus]|uniref:uncharacterized protein n=1 Tax=Thermoascus crustaceus TaxID=5088 RepID=UPI0037430F1D
MKTTFILLALGMVALAGAQSQCASVASAIPSCGVSALLSPISYSIETTASVVGCVYTDFACQCSSSQSVAIQSRARDCIVRACGIINGLQVESSANAVCSCVSSVGTTSSSSSSMTATAIATPTATTPTMALLLSSSSSTASPASAPSSVSQPTASSVPVGSSSIVTVRSSVIIAAPLSTTRVSSLVPSRNATVTYTKPSITPSSVGIFTGGAATVIGTTGGVIGVLLAVIAAL